MLDERHIVLGMLQTQMITRADGEVGIMECPVTTPEAAFLLSKDKLGLLFHEVAQHLMKAIQSTGLPKDLWEFHSTPEVQERMGLPACLSLAAPASKGYLQ